MFVAGHELKRTKPSGKQGFLEKLWLMLSDPENDPMIRWDDTGTKFRIKRVPFKANNILGRYFKHNEFSSFQRQLSYFAIMAEGTGPGE
jgi:hypothetical protein